jgi:hypothetical protein
MMGTTHDWLPQNHEDLYDQAKRTTTYVTAKLPEFGMLPTSPQGMWFTDVYTPKYQKFIMAFERWQNPATRTKVYTIEMEETEKAFKEVYRTLYGGLLRENPVVTNEDLTQMGLPTRSGGGGGGHTPVPETHVGASVKRRGPGEIEIDFFDEESHKKAKPKGVHGVEIGWDVRDTPPVDVEELTRSSFDTRSPFRMTFERHLSGKTLYFALRWENTVGEKGPWGEIQNVVIP